MDVVDEDQSSEEESEYERTVSKEAEKPAVWPKMATSAVSAVLIVAGFAYLLIRLDDLERRTSDQEDIGDHLDMLNEEVGLISRDLLIIRNALSNLTKELEYVNSTISAFSDLSEDIDDLQSEMESVQSLLANLNLAVGNNSGNITTIQNDIADLTETIDSMTTMLGNLTRRIDFLEHHAVVFTIGRFYPKVNDCVVGNTCDAVWVSVSVNNSSYSYNVGNLARLSQFDSVWLNWTFIHPNIELAYGLDIEFRITYAFGVFDIDGTSDSTIVSVAYDVINEIWSGEDDDGHTDGSLDGVGGEFDTEFWFSIETL
ncbi:MAG: hypothetical protein V3U09_02450 [Thermoplasmata archaeon]